MDEGDSRLTRERLVDPQNGKPDGLPAPISGSEDLVDSSGVAENIKLILKHRLAEDPSLSDLERYLETLRQKLAEIIQKGKKLRLKRVKLIRKRVRVHDAVLDLQKGRLSKESKLASLRSRLNILKIDMETGGIAGVERLLKQIKELDGNIEIFRETLEIHRRDRLRTLEKLQYANSNLQDLLTERILDRIILAEPENDNGENEPDLRDLTAEILGRLLVLEKEESCLAGRINRIM